MLFGTEIAASTAIVAVASVVPPSLSVTRNVTTVEPSGRERVALVPVATTEPSTNHCVLKTLPSLSEALPLKLTGSPETPSVSETLWFPPEILALGAKFGAAGAATVMIAVASAVAPSLSVTRNVTAVEPSGRERVALVPVATSEPSTNHCVLMTLPSLSEALPLKLTGSPETPSVSETLGSLRNTW